MSDIPKQTGEQTEDLWKWLSTQAQSDFIEFVADAHYSANWDDQLRKKTVEHIITRINGEKDIDLLIAMGTWAGKDFANDMHQKRRRSCFRPAILCRPGLSRVLKTLALITSMPPSTLLVLRGRCVYFMKSSVSRNSASRTKTV